MTFGEFMKYIIVVSFLMNMTVISMLFGMALFERSTRTVVPRMNASEGPAFGQTNDLLHGASPTVILPK